MTTQDLYNAILVSRWYIAEHSYILLQYEENEDPGVNKQRERTINIMLNTKLLENQYNAIMQISNNDMTASLDTASILSETEVILLISRNQELSELPVKN